MGGAEAPSASFSFLIPREVVTTQGQPLSRTGKITGGSNKKGIKTDDIVKNILDVELYSIDMYHWHGLHHHTLTKIEWEIFKKCFWSLKFEIWNLNLKIWSLQIQKNNSSIKIKMIGKFKKIIYYIGFQLSKYVYFDY